MDRLQDSWRDPKQTPLDFILVGAGAGGAPLAARLAERGFTVLVVEMGPEKPDTPKGEKVESTEVPLLHTAVTEDPRHSLRYFVKHFDGDPDQSLDPKFHQPQNGDPDERGIFYPRAQGVGGCTVHNAMITICGLAEDWDEIAETTGDESWRGERMRPYFQRVERCRYDRPTWWARLKGLLGFGNGWDNARHGHHGWLDTTMADLRFLTRDRRLLLAVLGGAIGVLKAGAERFGELFRAALWGRSLPSLDPNHWETMRQSAEGISRIPCAITPTGERSGPRTRLLKLRQSDSPHQSRLHLLTGVFVTSIVLKKGQGQESIDGHDAGCRAVGIRCLPRKHVYEADPKTDRKTSHERLEWENEHQTLFCKREVILCGGAFNTPQLLMLSGIGPKEHLQEHKIETWVDLPGVGQNLQDRYEVPVIATVTDRFRSLDGLELSLTSPDAELKRWMTTAGQPAFRRGLYATNGGLVGLFVRSAQEDAAPDLFIFALAGYFPGYHIGYSKPEELNKPVAGDPPTFRRRLTWLILKARTRHHAGYVRLQDSNPFRRPEINFRSFPLAPDTSLDTSNPDGSFTPSKDQDLEALHQGMSLVRRILDIGMNKGTIQEYELHTYKRVEQQKGERTETALPDSAKFKGNDRKWIKHIAWGHHACGTCRMGTKDDPRSVVDSRFRVHGVAGLRVVDASVFPRIPGFFIVANIYMIAEKAADVLAEDHPRPTAELAPEVLDELKKTPVLPSNAAFEARRLYPAELEAAEARLIMERRRAAGLSTVPTEMSP